MATESPLLSILWYKAYLRLVAVALHGAYGVAVLWLVCKAKMDARV